VATMIAAVRRMAGLAFMTASLPPGYARQGWER
jgi:hypothetical protein